MRLPVLLYHSVADSCAPRFADWTVSPERFAEQMDALVRGDYHVLSIRDLGRRLDRGERVPNRAVVITFDDGFADFHADAWPVLRRHGLPATVFVTTAQVGSSSVWLRRQGEGERALMSWEQIVEIDAAGIEVGAHGHRHFQLDTVTLARAAAEIETSWRAVADRVGRVTSFAYPHGYHTRAVRDTVRRTGFGAACAVRDGIASLPEERYAITRAIVRGGTTVEEFIDIIEGRYATPRPRPVRRLAWRAVRQAGGEAAVERLRTTLSAGLAA